MPTGRPARVHKYFSAYRLSVALFIVNVIGAVVYVRAASPSWAIPQERALGVYSVTGQPYVWAVAVLPIFAGFSLLNSLWGTYICVRRKWRSGYFWLATTVIWVVAVGFDFEHH